MLFVILPALPAPARFWPGNVVIGAVPSKDLFFIRQSTINAFCHAERSEVSGLAYLK